MKRYTKYQELLAPWKNDPKSRETILERIRLNSSKYRDTSETLFTEEKIAEQYYRAWVDMPPGAALQKIAQHPLIDKKMRAKIDEQLQLQKQSQMKWSSGCACVTLVLYSALFSRMPKFHNFFNHPNSWLITRTVKKTVGVYIVFVLWVASLSSSYEKTMPKDLQKRGLLLDLQMLRADKNN